ncbi:MAG TPA: D-glycerate dehydrogenase, partial [Bacillota bacterium]|nr:D-glycerate dehydrogenase [Bacillota bacterium]
MKKNPKPLIYITRSIPQHPLAAYKDRFTFRMWDKEEEPVPYGVLLEETKHADGLLCLLTETIDKTLLEEAKQLKIVANMAVGYNNIDIDAAKEKSVIVTNTPDVLTETTADLAFTLILSTARRVVEANTFIRENNWNHWSPFLLAGKDVHQKTLGIVGMGRIGSAIAKRAKGFDMHIVYHSRTRKLEKERELRAEYVSFDDLLNRSDYVISVVPLTDETTHMFNRDAFFKMQSHAIFINISRGETIHE